MTRKSDYLFRGGWRAEPPAPQYKRKPIKLTTKRQILQALRAGSRGAAELHQAMAASFRMSARQANTRLR